MQNLNVATTPGATTTTTTTPPPAPSGGTTTAPGRKVLLVLVATLVITFAIGEPAVAQCLECSAITSECEDKANGWCECSVKYKIFINGTIKICRGSGGACAGALSCDGHIPPPKVVAPTPTTIAPEMSTFLEAEDMVVATLLMALTDDDHTLIIGSGAGAIRFPDARKTTHAYWYEFTTARDGGENAAFKVLFGEYREALNSSMSGQTSRNGRAGLLRISDGIQERSLSWDLDQVEPFSWSKE